VPTICTGDTIILVEGSTKEAAAIADPHGQRLPASHAFICTNVSILLASIQKYGSAGAAPAITTFLCLAKYGLV